jgi:hypothetical protein
MPTVSPHTSDPQPEPRGNPMLTANDATRPAVLTVNGV